MPNIRPQLTAPIGILGYGAEGKSTARFLLKYGFRDITVFDRSPPESLEKGLSYAGADAYLQKLPEMATVFRSAGVRSDLPELQQMLARGGTLLSQVELFFRLAGRDRIIGVTGTLGKGTCCTMLKAMLDSAGIPVLLGGNIGIPVLDMLDIPGSEDSLFLLELSSFQLSTLKESPRFAAVLKTTSEHLDWHTSREEYWAHKGNLVRHQGPTDFLVHEGDSEGSRFIAGLSTARRLSYGSKGELHIGREGVRAAHGETLIPRSALRAPGDFNLENAAAAFCLARELGANAEEALRGLSEFRGLEHHLEFVRQVDGMDYYNDSFATRPEATQGAVASFADRDLGLILGGSEKNADFGPLAAALAASPHLKAAALIGQTAQRLQAELESAGARCEMRILPDLGEAVEFLRNRVRGGVMLLSPACASFGLFANYKERGRAFKRIVESL